jgi:hypothetical protein
MDDVEMSCVPRIERAERAAYGAAYGDAAYAGAAYGDAAYGDAAYGSSGPAAAGALVTTKTWPVQSAVEAAQQSLLTPSRPTAALTTATEPTPDRGASGAAAAVPKTLAPAASPERLKPKHEIGRWPVLVSRVYPGNSVKPVQHAIDGAEARESIENHLEFEPETFTSKLVDGRQPEVRNKYCEQLVKKRLVFTGSDAPFFYMVYECDKEIWKMLTPPARADLEAFADPPERLYTSDTDFRLEFFKTIKALREKHSYLMDPYGPFMLIDIRAKR